ncbi:hypothetical protein BH10PSE14_BH10PSE14_00950 [soil metagenome]
MTGRTTPAIHESTCAILPWRIVAGILLHFCVPAYLLACLAAGLLVMPRPGSLSDVVARMMLTGGYFLPAYAALIGVSAIGARMLDPLLRRRRAHRLARDPGAIAATSQRHVANAVSRLRGLSAQARSTRLDQAVAALDRLAWDHHDDRFRLLAGDLGTATDAFAAAFASAAPARRAELIALAAESCERLATAVDALAEERGRLDEGDARTVAGYIAARYAAGGAGPLSPGPTD